MRKVILVGMLLLAPLFAEKFDPKKYENDLVRNDPIFQKNFKTTVDICKVYAKRAVAYRAYLDETGRDDEYSKATIKSCENRIKRFCGNITSAQDK